MYRAFIRKGHGYDNPTLPGREPCTAFDGFDVIAAPLGGFSNDDRERRVWRRGDGPGVTYGSHAIKLAIEATARPRGLFLLMENGGGREVLEIATGPDWEAMRDALLAMDDRTQYAVLYSLWQTASVARDEAQAATRHEWAQGYVDKRIRKKRRGGQIRVYVETPFERDLRTGAYRGPVQADLAAGELRPG